MKTRTMKMESEQGAAREGKEQSAPSAFGARPSIRTKIRTNVKAGTRTPNRQGGGTGSDNGDGGSG
jgi:hypothetical protein